DQQSCALTHKQNHPDLIAFASTFSMAGWDEPDWQEKVMRRLDDSFAKGAVAVKVWKNIGMEFRASDGKLVMIDDPKFDAVFDPIRQQQKVLIGHQGEPKNCWLPIAEMTVNNDKGYFENHPQYHMFVHPEMPSYEDQMAARDRMLEKNREIHFMGAHLASLEWSVDEIAKFLDRFPNATADLAARMGQVQYQSSRDREKVRLFFSKYQDRILYATDLTQAPDANPEEFKTEVHAKWLDDWKYLNTDSIMSVPELDESFQGLALPKTVVNKIYRLNAQRVFSAAWKN
ncbi:MAG TPA: amidohydrolase family protein, partial [bacterium]